MKSLTLTALLVLATLSLSAQTYIENKQEVYGTWDKKGSPYIVNGEAIVPKGKTLKIKPGVTVKFQTGEEREYASRNFRVGFLRVEGTLVAKGKKNDLIHFTRNGSNGYWGTIYLFEGTDNILEYCMLEYGHYIRGIITGDNATGVVSFQNAGGVINNCLIVNNHWTAINCKNGSAPKIINTTIANNNYGLECNSGSSPALTSVILWDNDNGFYLNGDSFPVIEYSLLQEMPDDAVNNGNNLSYEDPKFINTGSNDFRLQKSSPCKKSGKQGKDMGALIE
ncbi:MAG: right-handed parallel beta-helix repeat-containing protein [Bacteroidota bacterium]